MAVNVKTGVTDLGQALNLLNRENGMGGITTGFSDILLGTNHRGIGNSVTPNTDNQGISFIIRPDCNLSAGNLQNDRVLTPLMTPRTDTYQAYVRSALDHRLTVGYRNENNRLSQISSDFLDDKLPYITLLTNSLVTLSGWPDIALGSFTTAPGRLKESWGMIDDTYKIYEAYSLDANFRNMQGDPITLLFLTWLAYMSNIYEGTMVMHPANVIQRRMDYSTRIYQFKLDPYRNTIQKWAANGGCYPQSLPIGQQHNVDMTTNYTPGSETISISFQCFGAEYNDPRTLYEFNLINQRFNPYLRRLELYIQENGSSIDQGAGLVKLYPEEMARFNYQGYPRIDLITKELQWWVTVEQYQKFLNTDPGSLYSNAIDRLNRATSI